MIHKPQKVGQNDTGVIPQYISIYNMQSISFLIAYSSAYDPELQNIVSPEGMSSPASRNRGTMPIHKLSGTPVPII